jgi:hypothetical protein
LSNNIDSIGSFQNKENDMENVEFLSTNPAEPWEDRNQT